MVDLRDLQAAKQSKILASICHGPWMLCSAKCLKGKKVTGFFAIRDDVENAGGIWQDAACVRDGNIITSRTPDDLPAFAAGHSRHARGVGRRQSNKLIDQILRASPAGRWRILGGVTLRENVGFEIAEAGLTGFDAAAELAVPASIAFLDERGEPAIGDNRSGNLEAAGEGVHAADGGAWNRSIGSKLSRRTLASKLMPPVVSPPMPTRMESMRTGLSDKYWLGTDRYPIPTNNHRYWRQIDPRASRADGDSSSSCIIS